MLSDGARRLSSSLLSAALGEADSSFSDDKHGQNAANALENAIFTAAAGDLPAYQQIFRRIYLDLKTQRADSLRDSACGEGVKYHGSERPSRSCSTIQRLGSSGVFYHPSRPSVNHFQEEPGLENVVRPGYALLVVHGEPRDGLLRRTYRGGPRNCHDDGAFKALEIHVWRGSNVHPGVPAQILPPGI
ncbi:hypothetical protein B0H14DRAFT_2645855 [Mycena olivaceomarginata]|nr:hypothetical protein B0H14DRAFT_2645855 [Mycena olivaceomarginata]